MTDHHSHTATDQPRRPRGQARELAAPTYSPPAGGDTARKYPPFLVRLGLAAVLLLPALLTLTAAPALAAFRYPAAPTSTFAGSGTDALSNPTALAVDDSGGASAHDVYVNDPADHRVEKFGPSGEFLLMFGKEVNETKVLAAAPEFEQNVCAAGTGDVCKAGASTAAAGGFEAPAFLAVDNSTAAGDLYVADASAHSVQKFTSSGALIASWATGGEIAAIEPPIYGIAVDPDGNLFVFQGVEYYDWYEPDGTLHSTFEEGRLEKVPIGIAVDSEDNLYHGSGEGIVKDSDTGEFEGEPGERGVSGFAIDPSSNELFVVQSGDGGFVNRFGTPLESFGAGHLSSPRGISIDGSSGIAYVANSGASDVAVFASVRVPTVATEPAEVGSSAATLSGTVNPEGIPLTECFFEYGETEAYGHTAPCEYEYEPGKVTTDPAEIPLSSGPFAIQAKLTPVQLKAFGVGPDHFRLVAANHNGAESGADRPFTPLPAVTDLETEPATAITNHAATLNASFTAEEGVQTEYFFEYGAGHKTTPETFPGTEPGAGEETHQIHVTIENLIPGTPYSHRIVATNERGTTDGARLELTTLQPPTIESFTASHLTATSADLEAHIDPRGFDTRYHFEYGPTASYGASAPLPSEEAEKEITKELNASHSIEVPIANLQPDTSYHFRLIAQNKWGEVITEDQSFEFEPPSCPNSHVRQQTFGEYLPDCRAYELVSPEYADGAVLFPDISGPNSPSSLADEHFAFAAAFTVIPGTGEPINGEYVDRYVATRTPRGWVTKYVGLPGSQTSAGATLATDLSMSKFLSLDEGEGHLSAGGGAPHPHPHEASSAPYIYGANGQFIERWPTNLADVPGGESFRIKGRQAVEARLPSPDFSHYFFSSSLVDFAPPAGLIGAPGSVYDDDIAAGAVSVASIAPGGGNIPPGVGGPEETIQLPAVSTDGSHILMSTEAAGGSVQLYMRVDGAVTYEVSQGHGVGFIGMTADGSKVYFTSEERLLPTDTDNSTDIYMWSAEKAARKEQPLTLVSVGAEGAGNSDACSVSWAQRCAAVPISTAEADFQGTHDSAIASENGDLYFYSPEQLDGDRGVFDGQNLYDYREGSPHFVATLEPTGTYCDSVVTEICSSGPLPRIDVAPDGSHAAFLTTTQLTAYDNTAADGVCSVNEFGGPATGPRCEEMYLYTPASGTLVCASCDPSGAPPVGDVHASDNGLFMTNDGRAFFYTPDPLVPADTNELNDVYEYVDGRPHLITTGLGSRDVTTRCESGECTSGFPPRSAGLSGVSGDGVNVYFSSYEPLVPQDHNGHFLRLYDARTNGGFTFTPPAAPCTAADECHGPGSSPPTPPHLASNGPSSATGNASPESHKHHKKKHKRKSKRHHKRHDHRANLKRGGSK
jgi:hypothetical protein